MVGKCVRDRPGYTGYTPNPVYDSNGNEIDYLNIDGREDGMTYVPSPGNNSLVCKGHSSILAP